VKVSTIAKKSTMKSLGHLHLLGLAPMRVGVPYPDATHEIA
jgi:hypothetical protein